MKQIVILSEACPDIIATITGALADSDVNIESITAENYGTQAVVTVIVSNEEAALNALSEHKNLQIMSDDALLLRIDDEIGALAKISRHFVENHIDIRGIRFVERHDGYALVAISTADPVRARALMKDKLIS